MTVSQTIVVTGAGSGIGYETARLLAGDGATVIVHARSAEGAGGTVARLVAAGIPPRRLHPVAADFTRLHEVSAMAREIAEAYPRIDVLVNNAATGGPDARRLTEDGNEVTWQVNYLAAFLLTHLLGDALGRAPEGRVINVCSSLHRGGSILWTDVNRSRRYTKGAAYAQSKLALTMFTAGLAEFAPSGRTAVAVDPGIIDTNLLSHYSYRGRPVLEGADPVVHLCAPGTRFPNGAYFDGRLPGKPAALVGDPRAVKRLWQLSERMTLTARV